MGLTVRPLYPDDRDAVRDALLASGAFCEEEVRVALEMVDAGFDGDYTLFAADVDGHVQGYACIGRAPLTVSTWYVYWICVHPVAQRTGIGRALQLSVEEFVREWEGDRIVLDTSGRADYARTRTFYERAGFTVVGRIPDFFKPGDDCVVYCKTLGRDTA